MISSSFLNRILFILCRKKISSSKKLFDFKFRPKVKENKNNEFSSNCPSPKGGSLCQTNFTCHKVGTQSKVYAKAITQKERISRLPDSQKKKSRWGQITLNMTAFKSMKGQKLLFWSYKVGFSFVVQNLRFPFPFLSEHIFWEYLFPCQKSESNKCDVGRGTMESCRNFMIWFELAIPIGPFSFLGMDESNQFN